LVRRGEQKFNDQRFPDAPHTGPVDPPAIVGLFIVGLLFVAAIFVYAMQET
jgi:hypothetical protein